MKNGVKAKFIRNVFPSSTFPNHVSIASGLYPESHGIVSNNFWDPVTLFQYKAGITRGIKLFISATPPGHMTTPLSLGEPAP
jgi:predicted AlkP superfamily pyrophosphatase or phosphodiesterase